MEGAIGTRTGPANTELPRSIRSCSQPMSVLSMCRAQPWGRHRDSPSSSRGLQKRDTQHGCVTVIKFFVMAEVQEAERPEDTPIDNMEKQKRLLGDLKFE